MIIKINKDCFKNLSKGTHNIKINMRDGYAEGQFTVDDKITFYIGEDLQLPFTATKGQNWADWILSYGFGVTGNNIAWVGFDNRTIYIDPRGTEHFGSYYSHYNLGDSSLALYDSSYTVPQYINSEIQAGMTYRCGVCCFDAGTQITLADGTTKNIEDVAAGDLVLSYNEITSQFEEDVVTKTIIKENSDDLVYVVLSNGIQIGMRAYHPLLTIDGWKSLRPALAETLDDMNGEVPLLTVGDTLIGGTENPTIVDIVYRDPIANYNTYNLTVAKNHNYIANGVVAHNAGAPACK